MMTLDTPSSAPRSRKALAVLCLLAAISAACGGSAAYRGGQKNSERGDWDVAVARFTKALAASPKNIKYKIALENARIQASRLHAEKARKHMQAGSFDKAIEEFGIAVGYDPSNRAAADDMALIRAQMARIEADKRMAKELSNRRPTDVSLPLPLLSPRSPVSIKLSMTAALDKVYQTLGTLAGVNVVFDPEMQNTTKTITANISGVTFQEALDQIGLIHKKSYRILDRNTILIIDDTNVQQRQRWDDQVMRTFYLENIEAKDVEPVLRTALGAASAKVSKNDATNAITVIATPDEMALADRWVRSNDKPKGEILVEVEILEINRTRAKEYGLQLSNYQAGVDLAPTGVAGEVANGLTNLRAHLLSSLNASDWVVQIPSALFSKFLHDDSIVKILSSPKVRAFEGKKATFKVGTDVPIPQFFPGYGGGVAQPGQVGGGGYLGGSTSATYKTVGVTLEIDKAKVSSSDEVTMEFKAEFSLIGEDKVFGTGANQVNYPQFLTRELSNTLRLSDGVTAVIGGLLQGREARSLKGMLGLESIPLLNKVLGGQTRKDEEIEILISLTPHILRSPNILPEDVEPMYLGLRNNLRVPGVRPMFGPELPPEAEAAPTPTPTPTPVPPAPRQAPAPPVRSIPPSLRSPAPVPPAAPAESPATSPTPAVAPTPARSPAPGSAEPAASGSPLASRAAWDRTSIQMKVGEVQRVSINLFNLRAVNEVGAVVKAGGPAIEFTEMEAGQLLTLDGVPNQSQKTVDPARASAQFKRTAPLAGGTGKIVVVAFRAVAPGEATISLEDLSLSAGAVKGTIPLTGTVSVTVTR